MINLKNLHDINIDGALKALNHVILVPVEDLAYVSKDEFTWYHVKEENALD